MPKARSGRHKAEKQKGKRAQSRHTRIVFYCLPPLALCFLAWLAWRIWPGRLGDHPPTRPNIVIITIDTLRADHVGCYGRTQAATPTMDRLAAKGIRFDQAIAHVPLTLPSHVTMMTGLTPPHAGVRDNASFTLGDKTLVIAEALAAAGYQTAAFISGFPLDHRFGLSRGFQKYDDHMPHGSSGRVAYVERKADRTTEAALGWLAKAHSPFLLWIHYFDPHAPYEPPPEYLSASTPYDGEIAYVDAQLTRVIDELQRSPTIVIVTSDHGESLGDHGESTHGLFVYDSTIRVPLIIQGPGLRPRIVSEIAMLSDIAPTILRLAGCSIPETMHGHILFESLPQERSAYAESLFGLLNCGWAPLRSTRDSKWKFIDAPSIELYDIGADPAEVHNVASSNPSIVTSLKNRLKTEETVTAAPDTSVNQLDRETAGKLASLGYISGAGAVNVTGRDPKDVVGLANRLETAIAAAHSDPPAAIAALKEVTSADPENQLAWKILAVALTDAKEYNEATAVIESLDRQGKAAAPMIADLADIQRLAGKIDQSVTTAQRAAQMDSQSPEAALSLARSLVSIGKPDEGRAEAMRALTLSPESTSALQTTADIDILLSDFASAADLMRKASELEPEDTALALKHGICLVRSEQLDSAVKIFKDVVEREPTNGPALISLAGALAKNQNPAAAIPYFQRAITAGVRTTGCYNSMAMAQIEAGDRAGARETLRASLILNPSQPEIMRLLQNLNNR